jgi:hypothetical protein
MVFFRRKAPLPPLRDPTDTVLPIPAWDDQHRMRACCLHVTYRFDDVLDPEVLRQSLERLLELDGWRTLGARLRKKVWIEIAPMVHSSHLTHVRMTENWNTTYQRSTMKNDLASTTRSLSTLWASRSTL